MPPVKDLARNLSMCPEWELNQPGLPSDFRWYFYDNQNFHLHLSLFGEFFFCSIGLSTQAYKCDNFSTGFYIIATPSAIGACMW